jgi:predicted ATPase
MVDPSEDPKPGDRPPPAADALARGQDVNWDDPDLDDVSRNLRLVERLARAYARPVPPVPPVEIPIPPRVGRFPVLGVLGRGGMGIVYRARDPQLDRLVAIKTLPDPLSRSAAAREQLTREARLLAAAHHPNLTVIHGLETDEQGRAFLILELVPGESLADRLRSRGAFPVAEALRIGVAIAEALLAAHEAGVLHGDLKPANVMIEPTGRVRVLDFGLARRLGDAGEAGGAGGGRAALAAGDAGAAPGPAAGSSPVIGTAGYIAPERLSGKEDVRADLFSFGCILYECLTGTPAFPGVSTEEVLAAVLSSSPNLDVLPTEVPASTRSLVASCLARDPAGRPRDARAVLTALEWTRGARPGPAPAGNLPAPATSFVGRGRECDECAATLAESRLTTLTGVGGCGKTRLAIEAARRVRERYPDGVWLTDLTRCARPAEVVEVTATALGDVSSMGASPLQEALERRLGAARALLLVDNAEHVRDGAAAMVRGVLRACPGVTILVTSRQSLGLAGERVLQVPVLGMPAPETDADPETLARSEAVALFVDRAGQVLPGFALSASNAPTVAAIVRAVEGLPLALELAAARLRVLSLEEIGARLDRPLALLRGERRSGVRRHATMRAALAWSADLLPEEEAETFRRLAVFEGGWDLEAACDVAEVVDDFEAVDRMARLADKSLIQVLPMAGRPTRYRMLVPVRELARERLAVAGEEPSVRTRHAGHFLALAERMDQEMASPNTAAWYDRLEEDLGNIEAALEFFLEAPATAEGGLRLAGALWRFWHMRGHRALGFDAAGRALERAPEQTTAWARGRALFTRAALRPWTEEHLREAIANFQEAARLFHESGDPQNEARALNGEAMSYSATVEAGRAQPLFERAAEIYREIGDDRGQGTVLHNMAHGAWVRRSLEEAVKGFSAIAKLNGTGPDAIEIARISASLILVRLGRIDEACAALRTAVPHVRGMGVRNDTAACALFALAELADREGRDEEAARLLGAAECLLRAIDLGLSDEDPMWHEHDATVAHLRARLGDARFEAARDAGAALSPEQALEEGMRRVE